MILLSYSSLRELIAEPHTWLCKLMELPRVTTDAMKEGINCHNIIQRHVSGIEIDKRLSDITCKFAIVETKPKDPATHFEYQINNEYSIHGYMDGKDLPEPTKGLEIKTSSTPWTLGKFNSLVQWKIAALAQPTLKEMWFITSTRDLKNPSTFTIPVNERHKQEAMDFIMKGINIIESGDFEYRGRGRSFNCFYIGCPFCGGVKV